MTTDWLSARGAVPDVAIRTHRAPWEPPLLDAVPHDVLLRLTYVMLDERETDGELSFVLTPWPRVDDLGRVRHDPTDAIDVGVDPVTWKDLLKAKRLPEVLRERDPHIGDAFAMMLRRRTAASLLKPVGPIVDVTADARDAAKAAFYGAVASPLVDEVAEAVKEPEEHTHDRLEAPDEWVAFARRKR